MMRIASVLLLAAAMVCTTSVSAKVFKVDPSHSSVNFSVKHLMISKVKGQFKDFSGTFDYDQKSKTLKKANGKILVASINTNVADRDKHLRSQDFFDVDGAKHNPKNDHIVFELLKFKGNGKSGTAKGNLTIKGITKPVMLKVEVSGLIKDPQGNERVAFTANGKINRKDYGLTWNKALETGGVVVGEDVNLTIEVEGVAKKS